MPVASNRDRPTMNKRNEDWGSKAAETTTSGAVAALEASIGGSTGSIGAVLAKSGLALAPGIAGTIVKVGIQAYSRRLERKIDVWMSLVAAFMDRGSVNAAAAEIEENIEQEWAQAAVAEGVRTILNDISEATLPFLARLTAHYLVEKKVIDLRAKRFCALLSSCDVQVLTAVQRIINFCGAVHWENAALELHIVSANDRGTKCLHLAALRLSGRSEDREIARVDADSSFIEAFHLLKQHQFLREAGSGFVGTISGPGVAIVDRENLEFLLPYLRATDHDVPPKPPR